MTQSEKVKTRDELGRYIELKGSQNKVAVEMKVSPALLSQLRNDNWENISEAMWNKIASHLGLTGKEWVYVPDVSSAEDMQKLFHDAQKYKEVYGAILKQGQGKDSAIHFYENNNADVITVNCTSYMDEQSFLQTILIKLGKEAEGMSVKRLMPLIIKEVKARKNLLFIFNEFEKLNDKVFYLFISFYNETEHNIGVAAMSTPYLEKRIRKGVILDKLGYSEILSRMGGRLFEVRENNADDMRKICLANGLADSAQITATSREAKGDIRVVRRKVNAYKRSLHEL